MELKQSLVIKLLTDAERDFRLKPDNKLRNYDGLCYYIAHHPEFRDFLGLASVNFNSNYMRIRLIRSILREKYGSTYTFGNQDQPSRECTQKAMWKTGGRYSRANWCAKRIIEIKTNKEFTL